MFWPLDELQTSFSKAFYFLLSWTCVCCTSCNFTFHLHNSLYILCHFPIFWNAKYHNVRNNLMFANNILRSYFCHLKTFHEHLWYFKFDMKQQITVYKSNFIFLEENILFYIWYLYGRAVVSPGTQLKVVL